MLFSLDLRQPGPLTRTQTLASSKMKNRHSELDFQTAQKNFKLSLKKNTVPQNTRKISAYYVTPGGKDVKQWQRNKRLVLVIQGLEPLK